MDNQQTTSTPEPNTLEERISTLEGYIHEIGHTLYDLIKRLQDIPDPQCPPVCPRHQGQTGQP